MADKPDKKADAAPAAPAAPAPEKKDAPVATKSGAGGLFAKTPVLLGIAMVLEAIVLFAGFKFLGGGPKAAVAVNLGGDEKAADSHGGGGSGESAGGHGEKSHGKPGSGDKRQLVEVNVVDIKAPNTQNGRRYLYDVSVFITVRGELEQKVKDALKQREVMIKDRMRTLIAQMDPEKLGGGSEPGLETLRRQVKTQLEIIIGDDMIDEVLVPKCIPFRADY